MASKNFMKLLFMLPFFIFCNQPISNQNQITIPNFKPKTINSIPLPKGFKREVYTKESFGNWLQNLELKQDNMVYLYNQQPKANQDLHMYVLNVEVGKKNLQQCADAIMKLRAMYLFSTKQYQKIEFRGSNKTFSFLQHLQSSNSKDTLVQLDCFLETVFINCGTYNLDTWLKPKLMQNVDVGDVFIKPGSPGHAMIVADVAINSKTKERIFLLAQSYMPAQSIHIVKNFDNQNLNPWYSNQESNVVTPSWSFNGVQHFKTW